MGNISQSKKKSQLKHFDSYFEFEQNINKKIREMIYIQDLKVNDIIFYGAGGWREYYKINRVLKESIDMIQLSGQGKGRSTSSNSYEIQLHCHCINNDYNK